MGDSFDVSCSAEGGTLPGDRIGAVDFNGSRIDVSLAMTPHAGVDDWVLVHAGFAITQLEEAEALQTWEYLREFEGIEGIEP